MLPAGRRNCRRRVTLAFTGVMAAVLAAVGLFLYLRFSAELDDAINHGLRSRASDVAALVEQADSGLTEASRSALTEQGESFAQILGSDGEIVDAAPQLRSEPLLTHAELERAREEETTLIDKDHIPDEGDRARLLATPQRAQGRELVVVVGASLEDRGDAVGSLAALLFLGGPVALLLASAAGYGVAAASLRPVEAMRRRAADISAGAPGQRLPVPPARDEVARLGETLNAMLERLEVAFARERAFVSDASHELRTPLAILKTELELALRGGRSVSELEAALRSAAEETDRLAQLAEDLLVIARSDQGRLPIRAQPLRAAEALEAVRVRHVRRAAERGASLAVEAAGELTVIADPLRLEQALGNLVDNALRHGGERIVLCARDVDRRVELHVTDDGPGFPDDFIPRAFERFSRADSARARGGAGLGLAIVTAIAHAHGGRAGVANRPEGGADTWVSLPVGEAVEPRAPPHSGREAQPAGR